ncbi:hypothetical protein HN371_12070 [Candidatus Poribacteria bacterium]|jgi:hypothetical protein|nr:hypothetical protein [Candidatus Poribacteria bacterium]
MAVASLISPSGVLPVREVTSAPPVQPTPPVAPDTTQPVAAPEPRNLLGGLDARAERRLQLQENAEVQRLRVELEEAHRHVQASLGQLDTTRDTLVQVRGLIQGSRDVEITAGKSADLEQQATDLARTAGVELNVNDPDQPGIISLEGIGFQPNTLGLVAVRETSEEEAPDPVALRNLVTAAIENVDIIRNEVTGRLDALPRPEEFPTVSEQEFQTEEDAAGRVNDQARALEVVAEIREHHVEQGEPLIHNLTTLGAELVSALIP